ncbi:hypothetical protein Fleli_1653 [Bernardetia litoralis DSM 6794]|uniref:Porin n=1 Tax=Bernardetia litoralis (strain ATCC 23117 / DSM 6794 / NBRC 15988 / NCIMB 1366 / Fx l1 / Sio-4) TaxID=880071 RepID=I4AJC8_BERLS|nr:putative porin [Bernardetia litoralis]AFM04063.1 hypothetical protein Fleli_1653 [Bernardetia litoralis DSM 6794]
MENYNKKQSFLQAFPVSSLMTLVCILFCVFFINSVFAQNDSTQNELPLVDSLGQETNDSTLSIVPSPTNDINIDTTQNNLPIKKGRGQKNGNQNIQDTTTTVTDTTAQDSTQAGALLQGEAPPQINTDSIDYAANSVWKLYEEDLYLNTKREIHPDTSIHRFHRYNISQKSDYAYQDLGNMGTASQSIFYEEPHQIGSRWGITAYEPYIRRPNEVPYFNTLAPYVDIYLVQGGQGKSWLDVDLSRNVNPDWNVSIFYRRLSANKVVNQAFSNNDEQMEHQTFSFTNRFFSKNHRYKVLAHFSWYDHYMLETGGVKSTVDLEGFSNQNVIDTLFQLDDSELDYNMPNFGNVVQYGRTFHIYQQYSITKGGQLELFQLTDYSQNINRYSNEAEDYVVNIDFYNSYSDFPSVSSEKGFTYRTAFAQLENKAGIKGRINNFQYRTFAKLRNYQARYDFPFAQGEIQTSQEINIDPELFIGGGLRYFLNKKANNKSENREEIYERERKTLDSLSKKDLKDSTDIKFVPSISIKDNSISAVSYIDASAEYQLVSELVGDYRVSAEWIRNNLTVGLSRTVYSPSLAQQYSFQPQLRWQNDNFERTTSDKVYASIEFNPLKLPFLKSVDSAYKISLRPYISASNIQNLVYNDSNSVARQTSKATQPISAGLMMKGSYNKLHALLDVRYNQNLGEDLIRMPPIFVNLLFFYKNKLFDNAMEAEIGTDIHYHSKYKADAYNPLIQQFHLQEKYNVGGFPQMDVFFNFKVSRAKITLKVNNVLLDVAGKGYYDTPLYIAQPRAVEVVINWLFFN